MIRGHVPQAMLLVALLLLLMATPARAVTFTEQAERLQLIYAYLLDFRPARAPAAPEASALELAAEVLPLPELDTRVGAKEEPIAAPAAVPRFRARYLAASGWTAGVTASPPVEVAGYEGVWLGLEGGRRFALGGARGELRLFYLSAQVTGPVTEADSRDTLEFTNAGADLRLGTGGDAWNLYAGLGGGTTEGTLTIASDGAKLDAAAEYTYGLVGVGASLGPLLVTLEQSRTDTFLTHYVLAFSLAF